VFWFVGALVVELWAFGCTQRRVILRERRARLGQCLECGYDLRASHERCPECGVGVSA
jgi:hypothetical protein